MREIERQAGVGLKAIEWVVLAFFAAILGLRATYIEAPHISQLDPSYFLGNEAASLMISAAVLGGVAIWVFGVWMRGLRGYRLTGMEAGVGLFVLAGIAATIAASDKRASVTDAITIASPMLAAMVLVQVLDSRAKVRVLLWVLVAVGFVNAYQCMDQWTSSNEMMIEQYEESPRVQLDKLGIEEGTLEQWQYEHRLYSKDVKGFFTTGNSAGAFLLMTLAAVGTLALAHNDKKENRLWVLVYAFLIIALAGGLLLTHSKGAFGGTLVAVVLTAVGIKFGGRLRGYRGVIAVAVLLAAVGGISLIAWYGTEHGTLPGGNSMLVRWQYWVGAAQMYADHPWVGVGGGNFSDYYTHYKIAAAPETVKDPHNFMLSLLAQYGPLGLVGFVAAALVPMWMVAGRTESDKKRKTAWALSTRGAMMLCAVVLFVLLTVRPGLLGLEGVQSAAELVFGAVYIFVLPAMFFAIGFLMLWATAFKDGWEQMGHLRAMLIWCGLAGVLAHNLIDFAIFEPGIAMAFWVMVACMVSVWRMDAAGRMVTPPGRGRSRFVFGGVVFVLFATVAVIGIVWPVRSGATVQQALRQPRESLQLLARASELDPLSPRAANLAGRANLQYADQVPNERLQQQYVRNAIAGFALAIERSPAAYRNYNGLAKAYLQMAEIEPAASEQWQRKAYEAMREVIARYPGSGEYELKAGRLADELGMSEQAKTHYTNAVAIEDAYRQQFKVMYPGRDVFSRLGEDDYQFAKRRLRELNR